MAEMRMSTGTLICDQAATRERAAMRERAAR